jgi:hypothetical protein
MQSDTETTLTTDAIVTDERGGIATSTSETVAHVVLKKPPDHRSRPSSMLAESLNIFLKSTKPLIPEASKNQDAGSGTSDGGST